MCSDPLPKEWNLIFVFLFTVCVAIINQANWKQMPAMLVISLSGYVVNWHAGEFFKGASTVSNTLGAMAIGKLFSLLWCWRNALKREKRPHPPPPNAESFINAMLYSGLVANIYSRLGVDPSFALYVWKNYIMPWIHRIQQRRSNTGDVEGGGSSDQHNRDHHQVPPQSQPRVGYGVVGAAMLPAIL